MNAERKWLMPLLLILITAGIAGLSFYFKDYFKPKNAIELALDPSCDLHQGPCALSLPGGGQMRFSITPKSIPLTQPLSLEVATSGNPVVNAVEVDFSGVNMNMGYNRPRLKRVEEGLFRGEGLLPVCIRRRMDWRAKVMLHTDQGVYIVPFEFETVK